MKGTHDELLGKARMLLMALDMDLIYQSVSDHGEVVELHYNAYHCQVVFADGYQRLFRRY
jgi:hypothetical protein